MILPLNTINIESYPSLIENEHTSVSSFLVSETELKKTLLLFMSKISTAVNNINSTVDINTVHQSLHNLKSNIDLLNKNIENLNMLLKILTEFKNSNYDINTFDEQKYNSLYKKTITEYKCISKKIHSFMKYVNDFTFIQFPTENQANTDVNLTSESTDNTAQQNSIADINENNLPPENTLIISETKGKVYLPYMRNDINEILKNNNNQYNTLNEIIEQKYTIPLSYYKNNSISRFKEAFKLVKNVENGSLKQAFDLGTELFFKYNLHPVIISACRNIDELDIYLDYLETNEIEKFKCFSVVFDVAPIISKKDL